MTDKCVLYTGFQVCCPNKFRACIHCINKMVHNVTNVTVNSSSGTVSFQGYRGVTVMPLTPLSRPQPLQAISPPLVISKMLLKAMNREKKGDFTMVTIRNIKPSETLCISSLTGLIRAQLKGDTKNLMLFT